MYERSPEGWRKHADFIILDFISLNLSLFISFLLRHHGAIFHSLIDSYIKMALVISFTFIIHILFFEGYKGILKRGHLVEFKEIAKQTLIIAALFLLFTYLVKETNEYSRLIYLSTFGLHILFSFILRYLRKKQLLAKLVECDNGRSLIVVCTKKHSVSFLERIKKASLGIHIAGLIIADEDMTGQEICGVPVIANKENAVDYICRNWVDEIFIGKVVDEEMTEFSTELKTACITMGITVHTMLLSLKDDESSYMTEKYAGFLVLSQNAAIVSSQDMLIKRLLDICGGLVGCFLCCVLFIFVAPCIFIKSPGPIFFSQKRVGKNGKIFKIHKFRSMYMDAEKRKEELMKQNKVKDGMMFKMDNDPRIISGIGHFIRDFSIDEFPQFFNVLKGDMSLVGTRPPTLDEWEKYELHHRKRLATKPGLTGMWQVSGRSNITDFEEIVKLDTKYIEEWTIWLDIKILFKTVAVVLKKEGSM